MNTIDRKTAGSPFTKWRAPFSAFIAVPFLSDFHVCSYFVGNPSVPIRLESRQ